jgi:hypothetical protein
MSQSWERISKEEYETRKKEALERWTDSGKAVDLSQTPHDIYVVKRRGKISDSAGNVYVVEKGETIKILDAGRREYQDVTWRYSVEELCVVVAGGNEATLKRGTSIAVLPKDWKEQLVARRHDESGGSNN